MMISKKSLKENLSINNKGESSNTITNASKEEQLNNFKRKKKEEYYKYKQTVCSDACEKNNKERNQ